LIEDALALAAGWDRVLLIGDAPYYGRFGFTRLDGVQMPPPTNPKRVLGRALRPDAWQGITGPVTPMS
ncbi:MAG: GNAT family N-acetyltransferase, partial [Pseudomonadota bacterium]